MRVSLPAAVSTSAEAPAYTWPGAWAQPGYRGRLLLALLLIFGALVPACAPFYQFIQHRAGHPLPDPLLARVPAHDVASPIFLLMYGSCIAAVGWLLARPQLLVRGVWAYLFLQLLRMATIWVLPLEPPAGILPFPDPFTEHLFHVSTAIPITKDLFFSGHTATVVLLALAVRGRWGRLVLGLVAAAVGVLVLVQHVHYIYDVLGAPLFAWLAYWLAGRVWPPARD
ncbi:phosphatase PAP2-related protein [Hymenobacter caeli]|uniref:Membrane-associated phospholipid phosphatase n=1 Tax=Hymenobacter caeli TaxID=2735894 RepID=A0ABX2FP30_9BACT|nr:phosphatase PAP2-related protein [Hymenobacter caeli]NRT18618.1 membrane-associated phospholipid phosphatase [Hymenobacter caeli]